MCFKVTHKRPNKRHHQAFPLSLVRAANPGSGHTQGEQGAFFTLPGDPASVPKSKVLVPPNMRGGALLSPIQRFRPSPPLPPPPTLPLPNAPHEDEEIKPREASADLGVSCKFISFLFLVESQTAVSYRTHYVTSSTSNTKPLHSYAAADNGVVKRTARRNDEENLLLGLLEKDEGLEGLFRKTRLVCTSNFLPELEKSRKRKLRVNDRFIRNRGLEPNTDYNGRALAEKNKILVNGKLIADPLLELYFSIPCFRWKVLSKL